MIPTCCSRWPPLTGSPVSDIHFQSCPFPDSWNFLMILSDESRHNFIFRNINLFSSAYPIQGILKHYCEIVPQFVEVVLCRLVHLCSSLLFKSSSFPKHSFFFIPNHVTDLLTVNPISCKMFLQVLHFQPFLPSPSFFVMSYCHQIKLQLLLLLQQQFFLK